MARIESEYYAHMKFDSEHTREVLRFYVPMLAEHNPVLELGCGRGELIRLLEEAGCRAYGVDSDEGMAEKARADGLDVTCADAIEFLHADPVPGPYGGVSCVHLLEHLTPDEIMRLMAGVRRVLRPGGRFLAVTPNPACYAVLTHDFWRDPTHVRFYDIEVLDFFCRQAGLAVEMSGGNPANHPGPPPAFLAPPPEMHPGLAEAIDAAMRKVAPALQHAPTRGRKGKSHDPTWAYEIGHLVKVLSDRLRATEEAIKTVHRALDNLVWGMYESNEIYVVARA
jgi:SAM-dependent methyltransferase